MKLTSREIQILKFLLNSNEYVSVKEISNGIQINDRGIRYSLEKIDLFLEKKKLPKITRVKRKGLLLPKSKKIDELVNELETRVSANNFQYSHEEIGSFIFFSLLISNDFITSSYFEDILFISRTSVINNISELDGILFLEDLEIDHRKREGFYIKGTLVDKSRIASEFLLKKVSFKEIDEFIKTGETKSKISELLLNTSFNIDTLLIVKESLLHFEQKINYKIDVEIYTYYLILGYKVLSSNELLKNYSIEEVKQRLIEKLVNNFEMNGIKLNQKNIDQSVLLMIERLETELNIKLKMTDRFRLSLQKHIELMIIRRTNQINVINPIHDQILKEHHLIYQVIVDCKDDLEILLKIILTPHDISFLVVYFIGEIREKSSTNKKINLLIVYEKRKAITNLISQQLKVRFTSSEIKKISIRELNNINVNHYDLVLSTMSLDYLPNNKFLKINNYLEEEDFINISQKLNLIFMESTYRGINHFSNVMKIIKNYTSINNLSSLELELINELQNIKTTEIRESDIEIKKELVQLFESDYYWEDAVKEGTEILFQKRYIEKRYENKIIENIRRIGNYMIIAPGIMLAHAGPQDGVLENGMSISYFKKGVFFNSRQETEVNLIFTVALLERKNRSLIEKIVKISNQNNLLNKIKLINSAEDLAKYISGLLEG